MKKGFYNYIAQQLYLSDAKNESYIASEIVKFENTGWEVIAQLLPEVTRFWVKPTNDYTEQMVKEHRMTAWN